MWIRRLLLLFAVYLTVPILEVPLFGFSLSAPLFCCIALGCLLRPIDWQPYLKWIALAALFWMAQLLSLTTKVVAGTTAEIGADQLLLLLRFGYWMVVFIVAIPAIHRFGLGANIAMALGVGACLLGLLRLAEGAVFGHWGGGNPQFLSQNDYGFGFSTFTPFATWLVIEARGWRRLLALAGWLALLIAVMGNGSRSSWITVLVGLLLVSLLWGLTRARNLFASFAALSLAAATVAAALLWGPPALRDPIVERAATLQTLDRDKPFLARELLVEKGLRLFQENPLFGAGTGAFAHSFVELELPAALGTPALDEFNRKTPHNSYIKLLAETGGFGAGVLLCLLALLAFRGLPTALAQARRGASWGIPVFAGFAGMSIHFWTLSGLTGTAPWFLYGLLAALIETPQGEGSRGR